MSEKSCTSCPNQGEGWGGGNLDNIQKNSSFFSGYRPALVVCTYWPGGSTILNFRTCGTIPTARNNVVLFQRGSGKYWKSLTARVKVLVQKEIRQHFAGPLPLLHLPQLCRLWHEQQHGVRSKGTSLKIRSDSGLQQSYIVSLNHENHESWI